MDVLMHLVVRKHATVNLILTFQTRIYEIANREEVTALIMQTLEAEPCELFKFLLTYLSSMRVENFFDISFIQILEFFLLELYCLRQGCSSS